MREYDCNKHSNGEHCWHDVGQIGFFGKFGRSQQQKCCHCGREVRRTNNVEWLERSAPSESAGASE